MSWPVPFYFGMDAGAVFEKDIFLEEEDVSICSDWVFLPYRNLIITYTAHRTNYSIVKQLNVNTAISNIINQYYLWYFRHPSRTTRWLERLIVEWTEDEPTEASTAEQHKNTKRFITCNFFIFQVTLTE